MRRRFPRRRPADTRPRIPLFLSASGLILVAAALVAQVRSFPLKKPLDGLFWLGLVAVVPLLTGTLWSRAIRRELREQPDASSDARVAAAGFRLGCAGLILHAALLLVSGVAFLIVILVLKAMAH